MLHSKLTAALTKAGATVEVATRFASGAPKEYAARKGPVSLFWFTQAGFINGKFDDACPEVVCLRKPSPHTDTMTDCYCDTHYKTIKAAVAALS